MEFNKNCIFGGLLATGMAAVVLAGFGLVITGEFHWPGTLGGIAAGLIGTTALSHLVANSENK